MSEGFVTGTPRLLLRLEGLAILVLAGFAFAALGQGWWLFTVLFLVPDISIAAYLIGSRAGAVCYNGAHSYLPGLMLGGASYATGWTLGMALAAIWAAHIGFDRALGYGLKYGTRFGATHLGPIGRDQASG